ncbi:MAG: hypothetical protein WBN22_04370 [Verrucomicrobiia bacterium]
MIAKCQCENCKVLIEFDTDSFIESGKNKLAIFGQTVTCPACNQSTKLVLPNKSTFHDAPSAIAECVPSLNRNKIRRQANLIEGTGKFLIILGAIGLLITLLISMTQDSEAWLFGGIISGSLLTVGIWAYLISQVVHVRANTHND